MRVYLGHARSDAATVKPAEPPSLQERRYLDATQRYGAELARFVAGYERDPGKRQELLQDVHLALWRSMAAFREQCSLRTWAYRVAHNACVGHVQRSLRSLDRRLTSLGDAEALPDERAEVSRVDRRIDLERVLGLVHRLAPIDRQVMLLYLEDLDAQTIAEVTGLSAANVATKVHRIKALLAARLGQDGVRR